ncbi:fatty acyl-CoA reductase wat [Topomyia yanbarensis]|uniref:fatty acyl-CoA reductase wat n=1 Tax=Topomyia yanbarensis TaxID=2498891 RepID=UPI00273ABD56|nr:fatty acyl-CoA reductase wat [Topomyia yanbarensis]XP_058830648.1 fatty acyl-CoA reductase wat [Topomyia yanbarensis]
MTVATSAQDVLNQSAPLDAAELQTSQGGGGGGGGSVSASMTVPTLETTASPAQVERKLTEIQQFYDRCNVFITGGTGFLGKTLIYKLLTSCPGVENIFLLIRSKRGKDIFSRAEEIFEDAMFDKMKQACPKYDHKIRPIAGDCMLPNLGISSSDRELLLENVNIVFHLAATVRFDEKMKTAMQINVKACRDILDLCYEMKHLKSIIYVSTAYTQCPQKEVDERFYDPPIDSKKMISLTDCVSDTMMENITPILLDKWPNTYTFTKAIAEDVVRQNSRGMPIGMFRPGIVIATYQEPVPGWIDNFYGPTGVIAGAGTGVLRTLRADPSKVANMVPVDLCVNGIISAAWDIAERFQKEIMPDPEIPVYNFCTEKCNCITWNDFTYTTIKFGSMYPTMKSIWYLCYYNNPNRFMHFLAVLFLHYAPAIFFDVIALFIGRKPRLMRTYKKIHRFMDVIEYFSMRQWEFKMENKNALWQKLSLADQKEFFFDMRQINWDFFLEQYFCGIRQYLMKDPLETVPEALVRWNRLYWLHQAVKVIVLLVVYKLVSTIWGFIFS